MRALSVVAPAAATGTAHLSVRQKLLLVAKVAVSLGLLVVVLLDAQISEFWDRLDSVDPVYCFLALLLLAIQYPLGVWRSQRGGALRTCLMWGLDQDGYSVFVEMDGDLSHRPEELPQGVALVRSGGCDVDIASKYVPGSQVLNRP
jgi:hypothetical protein